MRNFFLAALSILAVTTSVMAKSVDSVDISADAATFVGANLRNDYQHGDESVQFTANKNASTYKLENLSCTFQNKVQSVSCTMEGALSDLAAEKILYSRRQEIFIW